MDKTIVLRVTLSIRGDVPAVQDFAKTGRDVTNAILAAGIQAAAAPYTVAVRKVEPVEGGDDDIDADADADAAAPAASDASGTANLAAAPTAGAGPAAQGTPAPPSDPQPR